MGIRPTDLVAWSHKTRLMTTVFVLSFCGGIAALMPFAAGMFDDAGNVQQMRITANDTDTGAVRDAIAGQKALGRTCTDEPSLTDSIVFEWSDGDKVEVLSFDEAHEASAQKAGWVRSYCS